MIEFFKKVFAWLSTFWERESAVEAEFREHQKEFVALELAIKDLINLSEGKQVNLFEVYDGIAAARRLYATRQEFVDAFKHLIKG